MKTYSFVLPIGKIEIGDDYGRLPMCCTLMAWFETQADPEKVSAAGQEAFEGQRPITLVSKGRGMLGAHNRAPAHVLERNPDLLSLHRRLYAVLEALRPIHKTSWIGAEYLPHVADVDGLRFSSGTSATCVCACLIERRAAPEGRIVRRAVARIAFQ